MMYVCVLLLLISNVSDSARVLGIVSFPSYSHQIVFQPLWKELSLRGHQVTTLTTDPINDPTLTNLTEIDLSSTYEIWTKSLRNIIVLYRSNKFKGLQEIFSASISFIDKQLENSEVQKLIGDKNTKFDLVIVEYVSLAMFAFAKRFNCPHIGITSLDPPTTIYSFLGNPIHPAYHMDPTRPYHDKDTLFGRFSSVLNAVVSELALTFYVLPSHEALIKKHFGDGYPSLRSIAQNASALLLNTNPVLQKNIPLMPNVVHISGRLHRNDTLQLSEELKKILDDSDGFIYFSLGTNVKNSDISKDLQKVILETFSELPYTVLWKIDSDNYPNKPKNLFTSKWFPQQAILKHPNIKLFITQGGRQSMDEAIESRVSMVGVPIYGDQVYNVQKMVAQGYGLSLDYMSFKKDEFKNIILEVIQNPKYRNTIKELANFVYDQPMTGLEKAVWWTEFVLRHKGAEYLRSPYLDIPLYQFLLLDILGVCLIVIIVSVCILRVLFKVFCTCIKNFRAKPKKE